jgi:alanyl-tRNA synthetase
LGIEGNFTAIIAKEVVNKMGTTYPELKENETIIYDELTKEEEKFRKTLENGLRKLNQIISEGNKEQVTGKEAFDLFQTYGFPVEITVEIATESGITVDVPGFEKEFKVHQDLSRKGAEQKFKGGLGDDSEETVRYHTAAHLTLEALRRVLGPHVSQRGANITAERMRFDFSHPEKVTPEQIAEVEAMVNEMIAAKLPVLETISTVDEAKGNGATGIFDSKYGEKVKVYTIGGDLFSDEAFSKEICGGPHVKNTGELGHFRIKKEESSSSGVRRIKAVLE